MRPIERMQEWILPPTAVLVTVALNAKVAERTDSPWPSDPYQITRSQWEILGHRTRTFAQAVEALEVGLLISRPDAVRTLCGLITRTVHRADLATPQAAMAAFRAAWDEKAGPCTAGCLGGVWIGGGIENGRPKRTGKCFRCNGKGAMTPEDQRRHDAYEAHSLRRFERSLARL